MSDTVDNKTDREFQNAVTWAIPNIGGTSLSRKAPEKKVNIDDVKLFEERIKKQIEDIKKESENPTYLTVKRIEEIQKHAHDEAYKKAYEEGVKDSEEYLDKRLIEERKELKQKALQLQKCFNVLSAPLRDVDSEVEQQLTDVVFNFCKHILSHELTTDPSHILQLIQKSISRLPVGQKNILIKMNPADVILLKDNGVDLSDQDWKVEPNETVSAGGCLIETETSSMDLSIEDRLKTITKQLYAGLTVPKEDELSLNDIEAKNNIISDTKPNDEIDNHKDDDSDSGLEIKDE